MRTGIDGDKVEPLTADEEASRATALGSDLPDIITGPGRYRARAGNTVHIKKISNSAGDPYPCKGTYTVHKMADHLSDQVTGFWTRSGRWSAGGENMLDVVAKFQ